MGKEIGAGKFRVFQARSIDQKETFAVKLFPTTQSARSIYLHEKKIHSKLNHKNIIKYRHSSNIMTKDFNYDAILTEFAPYGNFYEIVVNRGLQNEKLIRTYFQQLVQGVEYLHRQNIGHLDLKLDNLLLGDDFELKIADFDQSQELTSTTMRARGTAFYRAPEILERNCKNFKAADVYSMGIILFAFKASNFPFYEEQDQGSYKLVHYDLFMQDKEAFWQEKAADKKNKSFFSEEFIELINGMLEKDVNKRFSIEDIKKSRWYNGSTFTKEELKRNMERISERLLFMKFSRKD